jgi:large subunit ribosomal protein L9
MKVILLKNVPNLGQADEIKEVSDGYARNFLLIRGLVKIATDKAIKELENYKVRKLKSVENKGKKFKELAKKLNNIKIIIKAKADEKKTLFGSVNASKIAEELKNRGYELDPKFIKLEQPIKILGYHDVNLDFGAGVNAKIGLTIIREE